MLERSDLWSLEEYSERRPVFRAEVLQHKEKRRVMLGNHVLLVFEDQLTIRYQIQEMLRIEKTFEAAGIQEELDAYNSLIPDGDNWKCTMLIQYPGIEERKARLSDLVDIENRVWVQIADSSKVYGIADEDLNRTNDEKTSAVHFLRFQFDAERVAALRSGSSITFGIDHRKYPVDDFLVKESVRRALVADII